MKKIRRVYLEDLVEQYIDGRKGLPRYATFHKDRLMDGPFTVLAAGRNKIVVVSDDGRQDIHFSGDIGLRPYSPHNWNPTNTTWEVSLEEQNSQPEEKNSRIKQLESLLTLNDPKDKRGDQQNRLEIVLFTKGPEFGAALYDGFETNSEQIDELDCEYANSLEEAVDKAIKRWS